MYGVNSELRTFHIAIRQLILLLLKSFKMEFHIAISIVFCGRAVIFM